MTTDTAAAPSGKVETVGVMVNMPVALKEEVESKAKGSGKSVSAYLREMAAGDVGYTGPLGNARGRKTYASDEEREAVTKARAEAKRNLIKDLMKKYDAEIKAETQRAEAQARAALASGTATATATSEETEGEEITEERNSRPQPPRQFDQR